ncbi:MAG: hypothetical protein MI864_11025 [Pseudomonadales bacterium]|nr:hypothetical protein [Pseudomonadales bacterium]
MVEKQLVDVILEAGILAPSADNSSPFLFDYVKDASRVSIFRDPERSGGFSDGKGYLVYTAIGAAIENMSRQAESMGVRLEISLFPKGEGKADSVAEILFVSPGDEEGSMAAPGSSDSVQLLDSLKKRCTDRRFPYGKMPASFDLTRVQSAVGKTGCGFRYFGPNQSSEKNQMVRFVQSAEALRFTDPGIHAELFSSLSFSKESEEGIPLPALYLDPMGKLLIYAIRSWSFLNGMNRVGLNKALAFFGAGLPLRLSPAVGVITAPSLSPRDLVAAGRALQSAWLELNAQGVSVHPYASIGVMSGDFFQLPGKFGALQRKFKDAALSFFGVDRPIILFRLGVKKGDPVKSGRRKLSSFFSS